MSNIDKSNHVPETVSHTKSLSPIGFSLLKSKFHSLFFNSKSAKIKILSPFFILIFFIDVVDECWIRNMLVTTLRCWWPIYNIEKVNNMTKKVTNIMILSPTHHCSRENLHCIWSWDVEGDRAFPNRHLLTDLVSPEINYN